MSDLHHIRSGEDLDQMLAENKSFTRAAYAKLLDRTLKRYRFVDYGEASEVPAVIWRHDIDYCPALALKIARIEAGRGARCIYHVLVSSPFYNVLDPDTAAALREIRALGHSLGLHFDMDVFGADATFDLARFESRIELEKQLLDMAVQAPIQSISFHNFAMHRARLIEADTICGMLNACSAKILGNYSYVSDSNGIWHRERLEDVIRTATTDRLHVLTHPIWWTDRPMPPIERLRQFLVEKGNQSIDSYIGLMERDGRLTIIADRLGISPTRADQ